MIHAFGDSFVVGDQDDFVHDHPAGVVPDHNMGYDDRLEFLKYEVSFAAIIAKNYNQQMKNYAVRGSGNLPQIDRLFNELVAGTIAPDDIILFGLTTSLRERLVLLSFDKATSRSYGPSLIDKELINSDNHQKILETDYYYILSLLEQFRQRFNVKIIACNLFDDPLSSSKEDIRHLYSFDFVVGNGARGNTLIDILNDTWGQKTCHPYHDRLVVPKGYESLYTIKKHPSIEGHKKVASWWIDNKIISHLL